MSVINNLAQVWRTSWSWFALLSVLLLAMTMPVQAKIESIEFTDKQMEEDYKVLIQELRCLVCQNQNLADSNAELAQDLRQQTYELLEKGASREEVVEYMVTRYGDFVMYRPPLKATTFFLWFGPVVIFLIAVIVLVMFSRRQKQLPTAIVTEQDQQKAHSLLDD
jgi:cytochrome c-type biogenesis protein CcmH